MGIFDGTVGIFTTYAARLRFRDKVMGGTPKDPRIIESWLRTRAMIDDVTELRQATIRTLTELGYEVRPDQTYEELLEASEALGAEKHTNGLKFDARGLYLESRVVKAAIKESVNILYAGDRWGKTKKGPRSFTAERVFIKPDKLYLGRTEPDGIELFIGHVTGPRGPQSTLGYHEFVAGAVLDFAVMSCRDEVTPRQWAEIWVLAQEGGLGALRSQGHGRFDVERWDVIPNDPKVLAEARAIADTVDGVDQ